MEFDILNPMGAEAAEMLGCLLELQDACAVRVCSESEQFRSLAVPVHTGLGKWHDTARRILLEAQFRGLDALAVQSGCKTVVDFPCGYLPRPCCRDLPYIGIGTRETAEVSAASMHILFPERRYTDAFRPVDVTNPHSVFHAFDDAKGEVGVLTAGLLMYMTDPELELLCQIMGRVLKMHGGFWLTSDPESACQYMDLLRAVCGNQYMDVLMASNDMRQWKTNGQFDNAMVIDPRWDFERLCEKAEAFLQRNGLTVERIPADRFMPPLRSVSHLPEDQARLHRSYWKIRADAGAGDRSFQYAVPGLHISVEKKENLLIMWLSGRLDTLSTRAFLQCYEAESGDIQAVEIRCARLEFISSAGLRAFLQIQRQHPVTLTDIGEAVSEVLGKTGFDSLISVRSTREMAET